MVWDLRIGLGTSLGGKATLEDLKGGRTPEKYTAHFAPENHTADLTGIFSTTRIWMVCKPYDREYRSDIGASYGYDKGESPEG